MDRKGGCVTNKLKPNSWLYYVKGVCACVCVHAHMHMFSVWEITAAACYLSLFRDGASYSGLPWWFSGKESTQQCKRRGFNPWIRKIPWRRKQQCILAFLPWTEKLGGLQSVGSQGVGHNLAILTTTHPVVVLGGGGEGGCMQSPHEETEDL